MDYYYTLGLFGGVNKLIVMTGARNFLKSENSISFNFKGSKEANHIKIVLNDFDLYDVEFGKIRGINYKVVKKCENVSCENIADLFVNTTKLYLSL